MPRLAASMVDVAASLVTRSSIRTWNKNQQRGQKADHEHDAGRQGKAKAHGSPNRLSPDAIQALSQSRPNGRHTPLCGLPEGTVQRDAHVPPVPISSALRRSLPGLEENVDEAWMTLSSG